MITYVNKDNSRKYRILYDKAYDALVEAKNDKNHRYHEIVADLDNIFYIDSLEQYFYYLPYLMEFNQDGEEQYYATSGRRYAILPLDEEHFEIDANSRIITVPASFRKNGIAVKGD